MNKLTLQAAKDHALAEYPRESCGLIVAKGHRQCYVPCKNMSDSSSEHFVISAMDYSNAEDQGKIMAVVHSHPNMPSAPTDADRKGCEQSKLPWHILSVYANTDKEGAPVEVFAESAITPSGWEAPLIGRQFTFGVLDCYTLCQDWYQREMGITLPDFDRTDKFWERGEDLYMANFAKAGFVPATGPLQVGDGIIMQIQSPLVANHAGIFLGDVLGVGSNLFIHHLYGYLSRRDVYGGYWAERTRLVVRYAGDRNER